MTTSVPTEVNPASSQALQRLTLIGLGMIALYNTLAALFFLPSLLPRARVTIGTITNRSTTGALMLALTGMTLYALYIAGAVLLSRQALHKRIMLIVWGGAVVMS